MTTEELPKEEKSEQEKLIDELQGKITAQDKEIHRLQVLLYGIVDYLDTTENKSSNLRNNLKSLIVPKQDPRQNS
jgi:uncharacterized coiled-coil protein SlyX